MFAITISEATQLVSITFDDTLAWASEDGGMLELYQGVPQNAQRNFFGGPWNQMTGLQGSAALPLVSPLDKECATVCTEGQHVWVYARIRRADGRLSAPFRADVLVGA